MPVEIRPADAADGPFLAEMLVAAAFWRPEGPEGKVSDVMAQPELAHYVVGWPQSGDCGVIAEDDRPVGAAWFRLLPASDPGFGFVDAETPEVGMGVALSRRGQGIRTRLLGALRSATLKRPAEDRLRTARRLRRPGTNTVFVIP